MKKVLLALILLLPAVSASAHATDPDPIHDHIVNAFKDIEAVFSWHVDDRKSLKEVSEDAWQFILS